MRTLRTRLLLGTGLGATIVLLLAGGMLYALIQDALWKEFDNTLATKARALASMIEQEGDKIELEFDEADLPEYRPSQEAEYYQVWVDDTNVRARSPSLEGRDLTTLRGSLEEPAYGSGTLPDGRPGRSVGVSFFPRFDDEGDAPPRRPEVLLVIARATTGLKRTLALIQFFMLLIGTLAVLTTVSVLAWSVRRGLRPVDQLATQIESVGETDLGTRIDPAGVPAELLPVVDRLNDLLGRLESAFHRERRFTADVAHELRNPLAGVRSMLEVALTRQRDAEAYQDTLRKTLAVSEQMQQMVENLLNLARADAGQCEVHVENIDLPALIKQCWEPLSSEATGKQLQIEWKLAEPCMLESDSDKLRLILQNVLSNAVNHANQGGRVCIASVLRNGHAELTVTNTGSDISPGDVEHVFDRFWRGDASRRATGRHCGLGLSLCKILVELLGGSIQAVSSPGGTFGIVARLTTQGPVQPNETGDKPPD